MVRWHGDARAEGRVAGSARALDGLDVAVRRTAHVASARDLNVEHSERRSHNSSDADRALLMASSGRARSFLTASLLARAEQQAETDQHEL